MSKVLHEDKINIDSLPGLAQVNKWTDLNINEHKRVINENDERLDNVEQELINEIVNVSAIWTGSGLNYNVTAENFGGAEGGKSGYFSATADLVTLTVADGSDERKDRIGVFYPVAPATLGIVGKIDGIPGSGIAEDYDPTLFFHIRFATVEALATEPKDTSTETLFTEGDGEPNEWTHTDNTANIAVTANDPDIGTNSIEGTNVVKGDINIFTDDTTSSTSDFDLLTYRTKLKADMGNSSWYIKFFNSTTQIGLNYKFRDGQNNFDSSNISAYQSIRIDLAKLNLPVADFDIIQIYPYIAFTGYFIDEVYLHKGSGSDPVIIGVEEAPADGNIYGRINKAWQIIAGAIGDMTKVVYDPTNVNDDAFDMDNMANMSVSKTTPIDADNITLWDSVASVFKKLTIANLRTYLDASSLYIHTQSTPSTTWTVVHNLDILNPLVTVYGDDGKVTEPEEIEPTDVNTVVVTFPANETGKVTVGGNGFGLVAPDVPADEITIITEDGVIKTKEFNEVNSSSFSNRVKIPLVSFIDDDGREESTTIFKVTLDLKGIKAGFSIVVDVIDTPTHMTIAQVKTLASEGHELINHCSTYIVMTALTEAQNREELRNAKEKLKQWGSEKRGFVYPANAYNEEVISIVREYCHFAYGVNALPKVGDAIPPFTLSRIAIGDFRGGNPDTINGVAEGNTLAYFKAAVDWANTNNAWLTFACHSWDTLYNDTIVRDLIDYIQGLGIDIVTPSVGYASHGSAFTVGEGEENNLTINKHGVFRGGVNILHEFHSPFYFKTTDVDAAFTFPFFSSDGDRINWKAVGGDGDDDFNQWITTNPVFDFSNAGTKTVTAYNDTFLDTILQFSLNGVNLTEINVTTLRNLNSLKVYTNAALTELSLKNLNKLTVLQLYGCDVSILDLTDCYSLEQLLCQSNANLTRLDFSNCPNITDVSCSGTLVQKLDFTMCPNLGALTVIPTTLIEVDIRGCSFDSAAQDAFLNALEALGNSDGDLKMANQAGGLLRTSASDADHAALLGRGWTIDVA